MLGGMEPVPSRQWRSPYSSFGKRMVDVVLALVMLLAVWPLLVVLGVLVAVDGGRPIFRHERVGLNGRRFGCLKLRSMVPDAQQRLEAILAADADAAAEWEQGHKLTCDPRITRLGGFLRTTSLDELPQLWNILRGEMSIVGPRPVTHDELGRYGDHAATYLSLRPGLTGLWQIAGRNDVDYDERVRMDLQYSRSVSLVGDLRIVVMTALVVLKATGR